MIPNEPINPIDEKMLEYQRQTKVAVQIIAWIVCIFSILTIIGAIVVFVQVDKYANSTCDSTVQICP